MTGRGIHRYSTVVLSLLVTAIGVALVGQAVRAHGSVFSGRLLLGALFVAAGVGRLYIEARRGRT